MNMLNSADAHGAGDSAGERLAPSRRPVAIMIRRFVRVLPFTWPSFAAAGCLLYDWFDAWSETFCPEISGQWTELLFVCVVGFVAMFLAQFVLLFTKRSRSQRITIAILLAVFPLLALGHALRLEFFFLGAQARIVFAGGPNALQKDAMSMFESTGDWTVPKSEWPPAVARFHPSSVDLDRQTKTVYLEIPPRHHFADRVGLIIMSRGSSLMRDDPRYYRFWKVCDGMWFYQAAY